MRVTTALGIPILVLSLALTACAPDPEAADCERFDAVIAAYEEAHDAVPAAVSSTDPAANLPLYDGYAALGEATAAAAEDVLPDMQKPDAADLVASVVAAADELTRISDDAIAVIDAGGDPSRSGPNAEPGLAQLDLANETSSIRLHPCQHG